MRGNKPYSELAKKTLIFLFVSGVFVIAASANPRAATMLWRALFRKIGGAPYNPATIHRLTKSNYIKIIKKNGEIGVELTEKGKQIAHSFIYSQERTKTKEWDHMWRVVMYDIPSKHKNERDIFRRKVRELGMYQLQKSVWIYPYDCKEEIQFLCDSLHISYKTHILYFETKEIPGMEKLKKVFGIL